MTSTLVDVLLAVSASPAVMVLAKATVLMVVVLAALRLTPAVRASRRALMLACLFAAIAALPVAAIGPALRVAVRQAAPPPIQRNAVLPAPVSYTDAVADSDTARSVVAAQPHPPVAARPWTMPNPAVLLTIAWAIGCLLVLIPVAASLREVRTLRRSGRPWAEGEALARSFAAAASIERPIRLLLSGRVDVPVTFGTWRPSVVVPDEAQQWPREDLERALVHEMEHVRRCDWPVHVMARLVCAIYWFHPLVWIAWRHLHVEADRACDDAVASRPNGHAFARQLVTLAERVSANVTLPIPAMARPGSLSLRVRALLDANQARGRAGRAWAAAATALCAACVGLVAPLVAVESRAPGNRAVQTPIELPGERFAKVSITRSSYPEDASDPLQRLRRSPVFQVYGQHDTLRATNVTLEDLLRWSHGIGRVTVGRSGKALRPWSGVESIPEWNELFDVNAQSHAALPETPAGSVGPLHLMTQALLADRFAVLAHWEPRSRPYYVLQRAGELGAQIRPTDCTTTRQVSYNPGDPSRTSPELTQRMRDRITSARQVPCTNMTVSADEAQPDGMRGQREIVVRRRTLDDFAEALERELGVQVVNGTGLEGQFDVDLRYFRDAETEAQALTLQRGTRWRFWRITPPEPQPVPDAQWPSIEGALRDQLGLVLRAQTAIEEVLVVDRAELPVLDQP